jgi:hypothetical protein
MRTIKESQAILAADNRLAVWSDDLLCHFHGWTVVDEKRLILRVKVKELPCIVGTTGIAKILMPTVESILVVSGSEPCGEFAIVDGKWVSFKIKIYDLDEETVVH